MSNTELEKRIAALEAEVALLKSKAGKNGANSPWWKDHLGVFVDDPAHEEAMRL